MRIHVWLDVVANGCTCKNGVAESGANCPVNGAVKCASCNTGWRINHAKTECIRKCANYTLSVSALSQVENVYHLSIVGCAS